MAVVLVVDDELGIASLLEDVLVDAGHRVLVASNGRQALEQAAADRPDLIITDFMMPVMDGGALVRALHDDPSLKAVPVILMSSIPEATAVGRAAPVAAFVRKPFQIFAVADLVAGILGDDAKGD